MQRPSQQTKIHNSRRLREMQTIRGHQALIAIGPFHELITKPRSPSRRVGGCLRQRLQVQAACFLTTDFHRKGIVEAESGSQRESQSLLIFTLHTLVNPGALTLRLLFQNGGQGGARVFRINIDSTRQDSLMADVGSGEVKAAFYLEGSVGFHLLRHELAQHQRLSKILGADDDAVSVRRRA